MVIFEKVRYKNLLSSGNYWTEIVLDNQQNTLIVGKNGSGKSTMLDALCFGLFGKPFRKVNLPQLVNSINKKDCQVEVFFKVGDVSYKVVRGLKPKIFEIYKNGEKIDQDSTSRDYQEVLEKFILKFNFKSFTQIVILGSASFTPFMQLSTSDRRAIIEDILDIQIFTTMNAVAKDRLSNSKDLITDKKYKIELLEQKYDMHRKHLDEMMQDHRGRIEGLQKEIEDSTNLINTHQEEVDNLNREIEGWLVKTSGKLEVEESLRILTRIDAKVESQRSTNQTTINFYNNNDVCPACKQDINLDKKREEIDKLTNDIKEIDRGLVRLRAKIKEEQSRLNDINMIQKIVSGLQVKVASLNSSITETNKYVSKLHGQIKDLSNIMNIDITNNDELNDIIDDLNISKGELVILLDEKEYYEAAIGLLKDSGIKTKIIKQYLPLINKLVNKYLSSLDFFVNFNLDESFKETIKSRHRDDFTYNNFSEGEKLRIDMALMLTWREVAKIKNSAHTNILILDEIFDSSLDDAGIDFLLSILHSMETINIFVISHKGELVHDRFDNVIRFQRVKNFSKKK